VGNHRADHVTPISAKVGIKIRGTTVAAQSVQFACGLKATEFVLLLLIK
jgi:hypothetical protein